jgi:hypothetical protein
MPFDYFILPCRSLGKRKRRRRRRKWCIQSKRGLFMILPE